MVDCFFHGSDPMAKCFKNLSITMKMVGPKKREKIEALIEDLLFHRHVAKSFFQQLSNHFFAGFYPPDLNEYDIYSISFDDVMVGNYSSWIGRDPLLVRFKNPENDKTLIKLWPKFHCVMRMANEASSFAARLRMAGASKAGLLRLFMDPADTSPSSKTDTQDDQ
ncbi:MAG: hypothetical protein LBF38_02920 [Deltaproteobacteria bacterium]|nr:hypothetical protein [Deltaproteobacteria bacterium]